MDSEGTSALLRRAGVIEASITILGETAVGLVPGPAGWEVVAWEAPGASLPPGLAGEATEAEGGALVRAPASHDQAAALRAAVPWLRPQLIGRATSAGVGDRLGIATPGHVAAFRANPGIFPVLAQQSARELGRTGRSFQEVVDAATFGALASGWRSGYGADADHLKTIADIDAGMQAGCTMFTADPIELVPDLPADAPADAIAAAFANVPWNALEDDAGAFESRYPARLDLDSGSLELPPSALRAAAARFGAAAVHVATMYRHLVSSLGPGAFEFEVAVDEIAFRTTPIDHVYLATELQRLGVTWASFAPRFVGRFEKGIDYLGDAAEFEADVEIHASIARNFGGYKLSIHSGSDKFSIYEGAARATRGAVHLKTSGTSYLVALATIADAEPGLMRRVWEVALEAYSAARASYHVSAAVPGALPANELSGQALVGLLQQPNAREILHVTYGAALHGDGEGGSGELGKELRAWIWTHREEYWTSLAEHIGRHLRPFAARRSETAWATGDRAGGGV